MNLVLEPKLYNVLRKNNDGISKLLVSMNRKPSKIYNESANFIGYNAVTKQLTYLDNERIARLGKFSQLRVPKKVWSSNLRIGISPGKILNKVLNPDVYNKLNPQDIQKFSHTVLSSLSNSEGKFKVLSGAKIIDAYNQKNYASGSGDLGNSCMRYAGSQKLLHLYAKNKNIKLLVFESNLKKGKILGRALLWEGLNLATGKPIKFIDRVYTARDYLLLSFQDWAKANGYENRNHQKITLELKKTKFKLYPYMDTMCYINWDTNQISNHSFSGAAVIQDQTGMPSNREFKDCLTNHYISEDDTQYCKFHNDYTHRKTACYSHELQSFVFKSKVKWSSKEGRYILCEDAIKHNDGTYIHKDNAVEYGKGFTHKREWIKGKYVPIIKIEKKNDDTPSKDLTYTINGELIERDKLEMIGKGFYVKKGDLVTVKQIHHNRKAYIGHVNKKGKVMTLKPKFEHLYLP